MTRVNDVSGARFTMLTVLNRAARRPGVYWSCRCDCGKDVVVEAWDLSSGHTRSCGCIRALSIIKHGEARRKKKSRLYVVWCNLVKRCTNPRDKAFKNYGGRGIDIDPRWLDFVTFARELPRNDDDSKHLNRIDNNKGYWPSNISWVTRKENNNNTRKNRFITHNGDTKTLSEWADTTGIRSDTIKRRLNNGWAIEAALYRPVRTGEIAGAK